MVQEVTEVSVELRNGDACSDAPTLPAAGAAQQTFSAPSSSPSCSALDGQSGGGPRIQSAEEAFLQVGYVHRQAFDFSLHWKSNHTQVSLK